MSRDSFVSISEHTPNYEFTIRSTGDTDPRRTWQFLLSSFRAIPSTIENRHLLLHQLVTRPAQLVTLVDFIDPKVDIFWLAQGEPN